VAVVADLECFRGEGLLITDRAVSATSITGWTISFNLKRNWSDAAALVTVAAAITDATNGTFTVTLTSTHTNRDAGDYVYDIRRTDSGGEAVLTSGKFRIKPSTLV
jgi:hypothetical protein